MAWIEFHQSLVSHRKLYALATALNVSRATAAGHLAFLWTWALDNAPSGDLGDVEDGVIKLAADWPKKAPVFIEGLLSAGFLNADRTLHDWDEYAGRLMYQRERNRKNAQAARNRNRSGDRPVTSPSTEPDRTQPNPTQPAPDQITRCVRAYDGLMGTLATTPPVLQQIKDWHDDGVWAFPEQGAEWFEKACGEAAKHDKRSLAYVLAILKRWRMDGGPIDKRESERTDTSGLFARVPGVGEFDFSAGVAALNAERPVGEVHPPPDTNVREGAKPEAGVVPGAGV